MTSFKFVCLGLYHIIFYLFRDDYKLYLERHVNMKMNSETNLDNKITLNTEECNNSWPLKH